MSHEVAVPLNPFPRGVAESASGIIDTRAMAETHRAIEEVQAAMVIAKKFPRNSLEAMERILNACTRPTLAATALYSYPRGGQEVTGPSIRLAEAMAQEWGNLQFGIREISSDNGVSSVEAFAWDVQTNTRQVKEFKVPHIRYSRNKGNEVLKDPRDIYEMVANQGARRLRACILGIIPGDVTEAAIRQCEVTQSNNVEVTPDAIKSMLDAFESGWGVLQEHIEKRIGKRADAINAPQMLSLRKIYASLQDGMSKPSDWFPVDDAGLAPVTQTSDLKVAPRKRAPKPAPEKSAAEKEPEPTPAQEEAQLIDDGSGPQQDPELAQEDSTDSQASNVPAAGPVTYAQVAETLNKASTPAELTDAVQMMADFVGTDGNEKFKAELSKLYKDRIAKLKAASTAEAAEAEGGASE